MDHMNGMDPASLTFKSCIMYHQEEEVLEGQGRDWYRDRQFVRNTWRGEEEEVMVCLLQLCLLRMRVIGWSVLGKTIQHLNKYNVYSIDKCRAT